MSSFENKFQRVKQSLREGENYAHTNQLILAFQCYNNCLEQISKLERKSASSTSIISKHAEDVTFLKAVVLNSMGIAHIKQTDLSSALSCFKMSLNIKSKEIYGVKEHPHLAGAYFNLGRVYHYNYQFEDAINFYQLALRSREASSTSDNAQSPTNDHQHHHHMSSDQMSSHNNAATDEQSIPIVLQLGIAYMDSGNLNEAKKYFEQALRVGRKTLGANDPAVANLLTYMGKIHVVQENYEEALKIYKDALKICFNGGVGGTPMKVLKELVRTTEMRAKLPSRNKFRNSVDNIQLLVTVRDFVVALVCDESQALSAFLTTNRTMEKRLRRLLELQVVFTDQFAGAFKQVGEPGGQDYLDITILVKNLISFFHDRLVIHRAHIKRLENGTAQVFDLQKQLFCQLENKLQAYMDLHDSMPKLVEIVNTIAMGYRDHERMFLSHTKMHSNSNNGAIREKLVQVMHGILKAQATRLETEVANLGMESGTGGRGLPLLYAPEGDDLSVAGSLNASMMSHNQGGQQQQQPPKISANANGGHSSVAQSASAQSSGVVRPLSSQSKGSRVSRSADRSSTTPSQNGSHTISHNGGSRPPSQLSQSQSHASKSRSRSRASTARSTPASHAQEISYASVNRNENINASQASKSRSRSSSRYGGSRQENANRIYQDSSGSWGVAA